MIKFDLTIIGGGPAGCSAAVYAARKQLQTKLILNEWGGQSIVSEDIQNWIGTPHISGSDLAKNLKSHVLEYAQEVVSIAEGEIVTNITGPSGDFTVTTNKGQYNSQAILITTGSNRRRLDAIDADRFEHKGLTYCASCDGPMYGGMTVAVIGGGNAAFESAAQLLAYCERVYILNRTDNYRADEITVNKLRTNPKLQIINNAIVKQVLGDKFVNAIIYTDTNNNQEHKLDVDGIFVEIGQIPATQFASGICELDTIGKIKIDPRTQATSCPGIWAAGDCTDILYHQNNIAAGDAVRALENIYVHLKTK